MEESKDFVGVDLMAKLQGRFSHKKIYYRDDDGVMKSIPNLKVMIDNDKRVLVKVYTQYPVKSKEINLEVKI